MGNYEDGEDAAFDAWWEDVRDCLDHLGYNIDDFSVATLERFWDEDYGPVEAAQGLVDEYEENEKYDEGRGL